MSPNMLVRLRDCFSIRDRSRKKRNPAEQSLSSDRADAQVQPQPQSQRLSSTAVHSTAITATPSQNVPVQTEASEADTQSEGKPSSKLDLWDKALAHLSESEHDRDIVAEVRRFDKNPIGDDTTANDRPRATEDLAKDISERMAQAIQDGQQGREQREWKVTIGDKEYSARGLVDKTVNILNKFVGVGDVLVSFDPVHAALPWAAVRFVLMNLTASSELRSQIIVGLAKVTSLILQCDTYRRIYMAPDLTLRPPVDILDLLEKSIVHTYVKSLLFLGFVVHRQESKSRMVSAPFKINEVESYIETLQESGDQLNQAAENCEKQCNLQNRTGVEELLSYAKESHQVMQAHSVLLMDIHQRMVFDELKTAEGAAYNSKDNEHETRCHPQTRVDLLTQIYKWAGDPDSECIYWLQGMTGTGKSTISFTVAYELSCKEALGASFFFKRNEGDRGTARRFITTIATQLVRRLPSLALYVQKAIETDPGIGGTSISNQFENLIRLPLTKIARNPRTPPILVIVIDALDECSQKKDIQTILSLLPKVKQVESVHLKVLVTSRPEIPVHIEFKTMREPYKDFILHLVNEKTIKHDIKVFLNSKLAEIRNNYNIFPLGGSQPLPESWPSPEKVHDLVMMAIPLFIFAETACQLVQDRRHGDPEVILNKILKRTSGTQLSRLNTLYLVILEQLLDNPNDSGGDLSKRFQGIVGSIVILANPLSAACLAQLLDIAEKEIRHMVGLLPSVLYIPSEKSAPIKPLHLSFRDFLVNRDAVVNRDDVVNRDNRKTDQFWVNEKETHKRLATRCLELLMNNDRLKKNMCDLQTPGVARSGIDKGKIDERLLPEAQYACLYWVYHLKESHERVRDRDQAHKFLELHFLHWLEALSLIGRMSESIGLIDELQSIVDAEKGAQVASFLRDAKRFVLSCRWVVDTAPLQLYASAIVFAPEQSVVRQTFKKYLPEWISLLPDVDSDWNAVLQTLEGHTNTVNSVVFSNDGTLIASGSHDDTIKIWNVATGEEEQTLEGHTNPVNSVVFSNDGTLIASGSGDKTIKIWNVATGKEEQTLEGHTSWVYSIVFSNDGTLIASGSDDKTIKIWNVATGKEEQALEGHTGSVYSVVFSNDGTLIASGSDDKTIKMWNVATGKEEQTLEGHTDMVSSVVFSNDGTLIASGSHDDTIKIWNVAAGKEEQTLEGHTSWVYSVVFSNDGTLIASGSHDDTIKIWNVAAGKEEQTLEGHTSSVSSVVFSNDGTLIASGSHDKTIKIWNVVAGKEEQTLEGHTGSVYSVVFSDDGTLIASGSHDETIKIWNVATGKEEQTLEGHTDMVMFVVFSNDGTLIASGSLDETIKIWNVATGKEEQTLEGHTSWVSSVVFSNDGTFIASGSHDDTIKIWNVATGKEEQTLEGHTGSVYSVVFSNDGTLIASGSDDKTIKIWNVAAGKEEQTLEGHTDMVSSVVFSNDSTLIASGSRDKTIKIWDVATGNNVKSFDSSRFTNVLSFTDDDSALVTSTAYLSLESPVVSTPQPSKRDPELRSPEVQGEVDGKLGFGVNHDKTWITAGGPDGRKVLWLPPGFRPGVSATSTEPGGSVVVIGCPSGRVVIMGFRRSSFLYGA